MRLRPAHAADAVAVAALHTRSWQLHYRGALRDDFLGPPGAGDAPVAADRRRLWEGRLARPGAHQLVLLAEEDGLPGETATPVGFACAHGADDPRFGSLLDNLHVVPERQGQGIGAALLARVAAHCLTHHQDSGLYLWVLDQNSGARRFYARHGAEEVGGDVWIPPGGGEVKRRRCVWRDLAPLAPASRS